MLLNLMAGCSARYRLVKEHRRLSDRFLHTVVFAIDANLSVSCAFVVAVEVNCKINVFLTPKQFFHVLIKII